MEFLDTRCTSDIIYVFNLATSVLFELRTADRNTDVYTDTLWSCYLWAKQKSSHAHQQSHTASPHSEAERDTRPAKFSDHYNLQDYTYAHAHACTRLLYTDANVRCVLYIPKPQKVEPILKMQKKMQWLSNLLWLLFHCTLYEPRKFTDI